MTATALLWLAAMFAGSQPVPDLALDIRVFRGATEVTAETMVTVYRSGHATTGKAVPQAPGGERRIPLPAGQYDLRLVQQHDGKVIGIATTSLRLLVDYPGEFQQHLEVVNFEKGWGALQIRQSGAKETTKVAWSSRLLRADGSEAARGVAGDGYQVLVAPAGTYTVEITRADGTKTRLANVEVRDNLTYLRTF